MAKSNIQWTESTINPTMGCSIKSAGCDNCYAMRQAFRLEKMGVKGYEGTTKKLASGKIVWTGKINFDISKLERAVKTKTQTFFFVDSMSDLFHENVTNEFIDRVFNVMKSEYRHIFQILTKRPERMQYYCDKYEYIPSKNIWLGVSVEDQKTANERIPFLLQTPAKVRWLSIEPLLGEINLSEYIKQLDWIVVGCES